MPLNGGIRPPLHFLLSPKPRLETPTLKRLALTLLAALSCLGPVAAQQPAAEVMVTVTSADAQAQGFALVLATQAMQQKAKVRVLLCAAGGPLALKAREAEPLKPRSPKDMLEGLIKGGVQV